MAKNMNSLTSSGGLINLVLISVLAGGFLWGWAKLLAQFDPLSAWTPVLTIVAVAILLILAMKMNPGVESFVTGLPMVLLAMAILGAIALWFPDSVLNFETNTGGDVFQTLGIGFAAVYAAQAVIARFRK